MVKVLRSTRHALVSPVTTTEADSVIAAAALSHPSVRELVTRLQASFDALREREHLQTIVDSIPASHLGDGPGRILPRQLSSMDEVRSALEGAVGFQALPWVCAWLALSGAFVAFAGTWGAVWWGLASYGAVRTLWRGVPPWSGVTSPLTLRFSLLSAYSIFPPTLAVELLQATLGAWLGRTSLRLGGDRWMQLTRTIPACRVPRDLVDLLAGPSGIQSPNRSTSELEPSLVARFVEESAMGLLADCVGDLDEAADELESALWWNEALIEEGIVEPTLAPQTACSRQSLASAHHTVAALRGALLRWQHGDDAPWAQPTTHQIAA